MKRNELQRAKTTVQGRPDLALAQGLNSLRLRVLQAKGGFLAMGTANYMPFIEAQAMREGMTLSADVKASIRQVMNCNLSMDQAPFVELIERALQGQKAA